MLSKGVDQRLCDVIGHERIQTRAPLPKRLFGHVVAEFGPGCTGLDHRDADAVGAQLLAKRIMETHDGELCRTIDGPSLDTVPAATLETDEIIAPVRPFISGMAARVQLSTP
jgi:hypothetical protein